MELVCGGDFSTLFSYRKLIRPLSGLSSSRLPCGSRVCGCSPGGFLNLLITSHECSRAWRRFVPMEGNIHAVWMGGCGNVSVPAAKPAPNRLGEK